MRCVFRSGRQHGSCHGFSDNFAFGLQLRAEFAIAHDERIGFLQVQIEGYVGGGFRFTIEEIRY